MDGSADSKIFNIVRQYIYNEVKSFCHVNDAIQHYLHWTCDHSMLVVVLGGCIIDLVSQGVTIVSFPALESHKERILPLFLFTLLLVRGVDWHFSVLDNSKWELGYCSI